MHDTIILKNDNSTINSLKKNLSDSFSMKYLGLVKKILNISIICDKKAKNDMAMMR